MSTAVRQRGGRVATIGRLVRNPQLSRAGVLLDVPKNAWRGSIVIAAVVTPYEPITSARRNVFLLKTTACPAKRSLPIALQMFKVQFDQVRIVGIGCEIVTGTGIGAHVDDGISHLRRQASDTFRIPDWVVPNKTAASERRSISEAKDQNCSSNCRKPCASGVHTSLPPWRKTPHSQG